VTPLPKIGKPATGAIAAVGITTLEDAAALGERKLLGMHGIGPKAVTILKEALAAKGQVLKP
jgi:hypothetical protein